jgi:hypothetical protein
VIAALAIVGSLIAVTILAAVAVASHPFDYLTIFTVAVIIVAATYLWGRRTRIR